jgi:hypothetical protein
LQKSRWREKMTRLELGSNFRNVRDSVHAGFASVVGEFLVLTTTVAPPLPTVTFGAVAVAIPSSLCVLSCNMAGWKFTEA